MNHKTFFYTLSLTLLLLINHFSIVYCSDKESQGDHVALVNGTIYTVSGEVIDSGIVVFRDGIITAVGRDVSVPGDAIIKDVRGKHVYPVMIHASTYLGLMEIGAIRETIDINELGDINPNVRAEVAYHSESRHISLALSHGIGVAVVTPGGDIIPGMAAAMYTKGWTWEEMVLQAPLAMVVNWPLMDETEKRDENIVALEESFRKARRYHKAKRSQGDHFHATDVRWEAMIPVLEGDVPVIVNASEYRQIQAAIEWATKEDLQLILSGVNQADMIIPHLKERDVPVIINSLLSSPSRQWEPYDQSLSLASKLYEAGVKFCIAGEASAAYTLRLPNHAAAAVAFGLPEEEALKSITLYPAQILGLEDRIGSIEKGKEASIIITDKDILQLNSNVEHVYIKGKQTGLDDKHKKLYNKYSGKYDKMDYQ